MACEAVETKDGKAILTCNTTDIAFGPIFRTIQDARDFIRINRDPRLMADDELAEAHQSYYSDKPL